MCSKTTLAEGVSALRAIGLTDEETDLLAAYLHDRESQGEIADRLDMNQTTVSRQLRGLMDKLEAAGLPIKRPERRTSRPSWVPDRPRIVFRDPEAIDRMTAESDSSGLLHGHFNGVGDIAETVMNPTDEHAPRLKT